MAPLVCGEPGYDAVMQSNRAAGTAKTSAAEYVPQTSSVEELRLAAAGCRGCDLYRYATQTVFGAGRADAPLMLVGEQPGDAEDIAGSPFVGPAGKLLRTSVAAAGIAEHDCYITNAVKHFKFIERGKRRIHASPKRIEVVSCTPWLASELRAVDPTLVVALGATAAQALLGTAFRLTKHRGEVLTAPLAKHIIATVHPSSILRAEDPAAREEQLSIFIEDLRFAAATLSTLQRV